MPENKPEEVFDGIQKIIGELKVLEAKTDCPWCRSHIRAYRVYGEDLLALAQLNIDMAQDPRAGQWMRRIGSWSEEIGLLSMIARFVHRFMHRFKGVPSSKV